MRQVNSDRTACSHVAMLYSRVEHIVARSVVHELAESDCGHKLEFGPTWLLYRNLRGVARRVLRICRGLEKLLCYTRIVPSRLQKM